MFVDSHDIMTRVVQKMYGLVVSMCFSTTNIAIAMVVCFFCWISFFWGEGFSWPSFPFLGLFLLFAMHIYIYYRGFLWEVISGDGVPFPIFQLFAFRFGCPGSFWLYGRLNPPSGELNVDVSFWGEGIFPALLLSLLPAEPPLLLNRGKLFSTFGWKVLKRFKCLACSG